MKAALLVALIASLVFAYVSAANNGRCNGAEICEVISSNDKAAAVPATGFVTVDNGCVFNCEWFVRTARRDDPIKPCVLQRGRNGKFKENCVQEQVCSGCRNSLIMLKQPFYLNAGDVNARCPQFPEDLDAFTTAQLTTARDICKTVGQCSCVAGDISPEVLAVRE